MLQEQSLKKKKKKKEWNCILISYKKINSKWIKDLNVRLKTIRLPDRNIREELLDTDLSNDFLGMTPEGKETKAKTGMWFTSNQKVPAQDRKQPTKWKSNLWNWEKIFVNSYIW